MKHVYIAHPLGTVEPDANRIRATAWFLWAFQEMKVAPMAGWILLTAYLPETPENRVAGLEYDFEQISRCDELWACGAIISPGMQAEITYAQTKGIPVRYFTDMSNTQDANGLLGCRVISDGHQKGTVTASYRESGLHWCKVTWDCGNVSKQLRSDLRDLRTGRRLI